MRGLSYCGGATLSTQCQQKGLSVALDMAAKLGLFEIEARISSQRPQ
jgi:hypothetical protein